MLAFLCKNLDYKPQSIIPDHIRLLSVLFSNPSLYFPLSSQVLFNIEDRALQTLPDCLIIKVSEIPDAGCGVFSRGFIPKCTRFGPYEGVIEENNAHKHTNSYSWKVGKVSHELMVDPH